MHSRLLVSGLPRSLPPLPPCLLPPPCLPCVEGWQRAAPHSSFLPTTAPLQTLRMDVWGPARVRGEDQKRYFLLVVDDYTRYTTVFPLRSKADVPGVLISSIIAVRCQLRARFKQDLQVLRLHSDRGGEYSPRLLESFCHAEGITQSFMLPASPQQNGILERRIGLIMEVARTSMIHAAAPHFMWLFAVRYATHQLNLWPRVFVPETSPTLRWTGEVNDVSAFLVWGVLSLVYDTTAGKLSPLTLCCIFLGFPTDALPWQIYHPALRRVVSSQDVTVDESVCFYHLHPHESSPLSPLPLFLVPGSPHRVLLPQPVVVDSGAAGGGDTGSADSRGAGPEVAVSRGSESGGGGSGGASSEGADTGGAACPSGGGVVGAPAGGSGTGQQQQSRTRGTRVAGAGGARAGGTECTRASCARGAKGGGTGAAGDGGAKARGAGGTGATAGGAGGTGAVGAGGARASGAGGARDGGAGAAGGTGTAPRWPFFYPQPNSSLPPPDSALRQTGSLAEHREPESCPASPVCTISCARRPLPPPVLGTHTMALRPSFVPQRVALPSPPASSLPDVPNPESDLARAASPTDAHLLATIVTNPSFGSTAESALVSELVDFAATRCLDYVASLVIESESVCPPSVRGELALSNDILEDRQFELECLAAALPRFASMLLCPEGDPDALDIPNLCSYAEAITGTYVDEVPPPGVNIVDGMWNFIVKWPPAYEEIWLRRPPGFTRSFPEGTQWSLQQPVYSLRQAPSEWHDTLRMTLAALGFAPSTADPSLLVRTDPALPPFYILMYIDDS
ncbi:unnamed protein product [Closterium sp. NIES-53]